MYLSKSHISYFKDYAKSPDFLFLFDFLQTSRTKISMPPTPWGDLFCLNKLGWLAGGSDLPSSSQKKLKAEGIAVIHHAFHEFIAKTFAGPIRALPRSVLLAESLASCLDIYFALEYFNVSGLEHRETSRYLSMTSLKNKKKMSEIARLFNEGTSNPFEYYKKVALEMYRFSELGLEFCQKNGSPDLNAHTEKSVKKFKLRSLYNSYDFQTFFLYVSCHCGLQSSERDLEHVDKIKGALQEAQTFKVFAHALSAMFVTSDPSPISPSER